MESAMMNLKILHDDNGTYKDYSRQAKDFLSDTFTIDLNASEDYLYVGLYKPFNKFYSLFETANINASEFTAEYYDGSAWYDLDEFEDQTEGFTESGFMSWNRTQTDWAESEINSINRFWIRLRPSVDHSAAVLYGMDLIFSTDKDLTEEYPTIMSFLPSGATTFISFHQAAKRQVIQTLRNEGHTIINSNGDVKKLTEWDINDPDELKQMSKYVALSSIFLMVSDRPDDKYNQLALRFRDMATESMSNYRLNIDLDDDGEEDSEELAYRSHGKLLR
jgi:hypothetical protein